MIGCQDHPYGQVRPILECIMKSTSSGYINAYFGFENLELDDVEIPAGTDNRFSPAPEGRSQTEIFLSGRSRNFPVAAFYTPFTGSGSITWHLNGYDVTASEVDNECITSNMAFQILLIQNTPPSPSIVQSIKEISMRMLNFDEEQLEVYSEMDSAARYKVVVNMTQTEGSSSSPLAAMMTLFGSNEVYSEYMLRVRGLGVNPSEVTTINTGIEKYGTPRNSTPTTAPTGTPSASTPPETGGNPSPPLNDNHNPVLAPIVGAPLPGSSSSLLVETFYVIFLLSLAIIGLV